MSIIFEKIRLIHDDLKNFEIQGSNGDSRLLGKLSRVNIVVGTNNSGKSRLLRGISKIENLSFVLKNFSKEFVTTPVQKETIKQKERYSHALARTSP